MVKINLVCFARVEEKILLLQSDVVPAELECLGGMKNRKGSLKCKSTGYHLANQRRVYLLGGTGGDD